MLSLTREEECARLIKHYGDKSFESLMAVLERQFLVLHNRSQVMLGLCGIVITTTGFSGRLVAGTSKFGQASIVGGLALVLLSAAVVVWGTLHLRWLTQQCGEETKTWLMTVLKYRDRKTNAYRVGVSLMLAGLTMYGAAIGGMLLHPERAVVQASR